jgi:hypothetical protein
MLGFVSFNSLLGRPHSGAQYALGEEVRDRCREGYTHRQEHDAAYSPLPVET